MRGDTRYSSLSAGKCLRRPVKLMLWRLVLYAGMRARDAHRAGTKAPSLRPGPRPARPLADAPLRRRHEPFGPPTRRRPCMTPLRPLAPEPPSRFPAPARFCFPGGSRAAVPSYVSPGPAGSRSARRGPGPPPPAAGRRHAVPSASRPAGRARTGAPSSPQPGGPCRLPMRFRRGCRPAVPSFVSPAPLPSPSYVCMRSEGPRCQQLFPDFFQELFPGRRARRLGRSTGWARRERR
jgi:hypothetical protein